MDQLTILFSLVGIAAIILIIYVKITDKQSSTQAKSEQNH